MYISIVTNMFMIMDLVLVPIDYTKKLKKVQFKAFLN